MFTIHDKTKIKRLPNIPWRSFENECTVLDLEKGDYYTLDEVGSFIWILLDGKYTAGRITRKIADHFDIDSETAMADLSEFAAKLHRLHFAEISH